MGKKKEDVHFCIFTEAIECNLGGRYCDRCGWNPIVAEIRVTALKNGERRFLRYSNRDYDAVVPREKQKFKS